MSRGMALLALFCSVSSFLFTVWIVVPAPATALWLVSVISSEWSLYFGLLAVVGVVLGLRGRRVGTRNLTIGLGLMALIFSAYPAVVSWPVAASNGVGLSVARYFSGPPGTRRAARETFVYSRAAGAPLELDVYTGAPSAPSAPLRPAVVVVHGGSWKSGTRSDFPQWNDWLVESGFVVFDVDYRLSPQPNWETATRDVRTAVRWVKMRAASFGADSTRVALMGRSAGGHLALLAAYTAADGSLDGASADVQAVVAFYPPTDLAWGYTHPANQRVTDGPGTLRLFTGGTPVSNPEVYRSASPIHHVASGTPPTLLLHGGRDQLVLAGNSVRLLDALLGSGSGPIHQMVLIPYAQHGFDYNFNGWGSQITQAVLRPFLETHLEHD
jgi:acetyl esterase/lipase